MDTDERAHQGQERRGIESAEEFRKKGRGEWEKGKQPDWQPPYGWS